MSLKPTINQVQALGHHQTTYDWGIQFISLPSLITGFDTADLNTRCTSSTIPSRSIQEMQINLRGHKVFQHGIVEYGNKLTLNLYETADSKVQNFLEAYMDMQWMPITGVQVPKSLNQCAFLLTLLDAEHNPTHYYTILGAWLQDYKPSGDMQSDGSSLLSYQTVWTFDYYLSSVK